MRQALHIFKKDVRYLQWEIALFVMISVLFAWHATQATISARLGENLLVLASIYLIARLIHAEAIPGDAQFWITRPYRWRSLLGAKLLFILVVVNLPLLAARLAILVASGFPLLSNLPGLLWSQLLIIVCSFLPAAELAALTSGVVQVAATLLIFGITASTVLANTSRDTFWYSPGTVDWIRTSIAILISVAVATFVLVRQYRDRATLFSRIFVAGATVLTFWVYWNIPATFELNAQSRLSKQPSQSAPVQVAIDPLRKTVRFSSRPPGVGTELIQIDVPFVMSGLRGGQEVRVDALGFNFESADGQTYKSGLTGAVDSKTLDKVYEANLFIDSSFFNAVRERPVRITASVYLTLFGNPETKTFPLQETPVNVMDGLQCYIRGERVVLRTAFREPAKLVSVRIGDSTDSVPVFSYSPFPADLRLSPIGEGRFGPRPLGSQATITSMEPLAHFHRNVDLQNAHLPDFAVGLN